MSTFSKWKLGAFFGLAAVVAMLAFIATPAFAGPIPPSYCNPCLFFGGNLDTTDSNANGLSNEQDLLVSQSAIYTPFVVPNGQTWNVTGLFTDNLMSINALTANWEIRSGVSSGNGGTLLFSGTSNSPVVTDTGINDFGLEDFAVGVTGLSGISLGPGTYWLSVVPICLDANNSTCSGRSFQADTDGLDAFGPTEPQNNAFWNSSFFGQNFSLITPGTDGGPFDTTFSGGVIGSMSTSVPEPGILGMFGLGVLLIGVFVGLRRRLH